MNSLFHRHFDSFKDRSEIINAIDLESVELTHQDWFSRQLPEIDENLANVLCMKYQSVLDSLVYANSFIGNEFMYLQYVMHQLCIWNAIAIDGEPSDSEFNICKTEIQLLFYTMVNLIYNIKEKLSDLCSVSKGEKKNQDTIINQETQRRLVGVFKSEYEHIARSCHARKWLVHKSYSILYMKEEQSVRFYYTELDFSTNRVDQGKKEIMDFQINQEGLVVPLTALQRSIVSVLQNLSDLKNISPEQLLGKFRTTSNGNPAIQITL